MRLTNESKRREMGCCIEREKKTASTKVLRLNDKDNGKKTTQKSELFIVLKKRANRNALGARGREGKANTSHSE
jgi:hypothetical protein